MAEPPTSGWAIRGAGVLVDSCAGFSGLLLLLPVCACTPATTVRMRPRAAAEHTPFDHDRGCWTKDEWEEDGVIKTGTVDSTLPWSLGEPKAGCNLSWTLKRLSANGNTGEGQDDAATYGRAKDAGGL